MMELKLIYVSQRDQKSSSFHPQLHQQTYMEKHGAVKQFCICVISLSSSLRSTQKEMLCDHIVKGKTPITFSFVIKKDGISSA